MTVSIRAAREQDFRPARAMLSEAGLPVSDLNPEQLAFVAEDNGDVVGLIGFEAFGDVGLLRSLVVAEDARFLGLGRQLVALPETSARDRGVAEIWLLTMDADPYFSNLGFRVRARDEAPQAIRGTAEFAELCPGDAVLMSKGSAAV